MSLVDEVIVKAHEVLVIPGMPWDNIGDYFTGEVAWREILLESQMRAIEAIKRTNITIDEIKDLSEANALEAVTDIWARVTPGAGDLLDALKKGDFAAFSTALPRQHLRNALISVYAYNRIGSNLHYEGAFARGIDAGRISMVEAEAHLDRCMRIWDGIAALGERGVLEKLLPAPGVHGVGQGGPLELTAGTIILIVLLAGVAVLAVLGMTLVLGLMLLQKRAQERAFDQCDELLKLEKFEEARQCREAALDAANENTQSAMDKIMEPLTFAAWALGIGAILYIGTTFVLPALRSIPKPRTAGVASA